MVGLFLRIHSGKFSVGKRQLQAAQVILQMLRRCREQRDHARISLATVQIDHPCHHQRAGADALLPCADEKGFFRLAVKKLILMNLMMSLQQI